VLQTGEIRYRFQLIMQELVQGGQLEVIQAQSDALQYIQDLLAHYYYTLTQYDFDLNVNVTPFREKYDDQVAGMTAQIELIVKNTLNDCITPYE